MAQHLQVDIWLFPLQPKRISAGLKQVSDGTINVESIDNVNNFKFKAQTSDPGAGSPLETGTVLFVYS